MIGPGGPISWSSIERTGVTTDLIDVLRKSQPASLAPSFGEEQGTRVLNRNVVTAPDQAYALYWSVPASRWEELLAVHEYAHILHLDQARGLSRPLRAIFGRNPIGFPNEWAPYWMIEGLATFYERTIGTQAERVSPFSIWGQVESLGWLQTLLQAGTTRLRLQDCAPRACTPVTSNRRRARCSCSRCR